MQSLAPPLGFVIPIGACAAPASCPAGTYAVAGYQITLSDSFRPNGILNYPSVLDVVVTHQQPSIFARMVGYTQLSSAASARASTPGPQFNGAVYAVAAVSSDAMINGGGAAFQTVTGPVYAYGSFGANNGPHSTGIPSVQTNYDGTVCPGSPSNFLDNGGGGNGLNYHTTDGNPITNNMSIPPPTNFDNASPVAAGSPPPSYSSAAQAKDALGHCASLASAERDDRRGYVESARAVATARAVSNSLAVIRTTPVSKSALAFSAGSICDSTAFIGTGGSHSST